MELRQYIADAFTDRLFSGTQASVCWPQNPLDAELMQKIALENNFSETAFAAKTENCYNLRWFTPGGEVDLCGHATLGTAFVIMTEVEPDCQMIEFSTKSGILTVARDGSLFSMNFPQSEYKKVDVTDEMEKAIGIRPLKAYLGRDLLMVLPSEDDVINLKPDQSFLKKIAPYWSKVLGKKSINAYQASRRGGKLICEILPDNRIDISGPCVLYSKAELYI